MPDPMSFDLLTVPKFAARTGLRVLDVAWGTAGHVVDLLRREDAASARSAAPAAAPPRNGTHPPARTAAPPAPAPETRAPRPAPAAPTPPPAATPAPEPVPAPEPEPDELVAEFADPGAEEGAGAQVHVDEPWDGYAGMKAADIVDRLTVADAATLAAVQLYEGAHRNRRTVIAAAKTRLRQA